MSFFLFMFFIYKLSHLKNIIFTIIKAIFKQNSIFKGLPLVILFLNFFPKTKFKFFGCIPLDDLIILIFYLL